jgi:hypothetical protein
MILGLLGALGAAVCYGAASILQALAARRERTSEGLDPRLLLRLAKSWQYLLGLGLDGFAFLLSIVALQTMPLFAVQAIVSSFLAITAVLGAIFLRMPLTRRDKVALAVVIGGLIMVGMSAAEDAAVAVSSGERWGILVAALALAALAVPLGRLKGAKGAAALGGVAGLGFGAVAVAARVLPRIGWDTLFSTWAPCFATPPPTPWPSPPWSRCCRTPLPCSGAASPRPPRRSSSARPSCRRSSGSSCSVTSPARAGRGWPWSGSPWPSGAPSRWPGTATSRRRRRPATGCPSARRRRRAPTRNGDTRRRTAAPPR